MAEKGKFGQEPRLIEWQGKTWKFQELAEHYKINPRTLSSRLDRQGWSLTKALNTKVKDATRTKKAKAKKQKPSVSSAKSAVTKILLDKFMENRKHFEKWIDDEMKHNPGGFFKYNMLPLLKNHQEQTAGVNVNQAVIHIQLPEGYKPPTETLDIIEHPKLEDN